MFLKSICFLLYLIASCFAGYLQPDGSPVIEFPNNGRIIGIPQTKDNVSFYSFKGIRFGKLPVRFKLPQPAEALIGDFNATKNPKPCTQFVLGVEDCLFLNVYLPENALDISSSDEKFPVMEFIHGGVFWIGSIRFYDHIQALVDKGVIVVLIQYRLGTLGFLSTEDDEAPGNLGLWDQNLGMKWVKNNIAYFGGDPNRITLFGESAGSASTHYHMLSPHSAGLFNQAILESGTALSPWSMGRDFLETAKTVAGNLNCPTDNSTDLIVCLQNKNEYRVSMQLISTFEWLIAPVYIAPRVDGNFLPDEPAQLIKDGNFNKVKTMMGFTRDEGSLVSGIMYTLQENIDKLVNNFTEYGPRSLSLYDDEGWDTTAEFIYDRYLDSKDNIDTQDADNLTKLYSHRYFHIPGDWVAEYQADLVDTYLYELDYRGKFSLLLDLYKILGMDLPQADNYVCHFDDIQYLFQGFMPEVDRHMGDIISTLWTNFAKAGNPTPDDSLGFIWQNSTSDNLRFLSITETPSMQPYDRAEDKIFWESLPLRVNTILQE